MLCPNHVLMGNFRGHEVFWKVFLLEDLEVIWTLELQCKVNHLLNINFASFSHIAEHSTLFLLGSKYSVIRMNHSQEWNINLPLVLFSTSWIVQIKPYWGQLTPWKPGSAEPCETCCSWRCWTSTVAQKMDVVPEPIGHHPFDQPRPRNSDKCRFIGIPEPKKYDKNPVGDDCILGGW